MKTYIKPATKVTKVQAMHILAASGLTTGGSLRNNYYENDATYAKEDNFWDED